MEKIVNFSQRLVEERKRLKLLQKNFSELAGVHKKSQVDYEKGRFPAFVAYLERIAEMGVDVQYVLTGQRSAEPVLTPEEKNLLDAWQNAPQAVRAAALAALQAGADAKKPSRQIIGGNVHTEPGGKTIIAENIGSLKM